MSRRNIYRHLRSENEHGNEDLGGRLQKPVALWELVFIDKKNHQQSVLIKCDSHADLSEPAAANVMEPRQRDR